MKTALIGATIFVIGFISMVIYTWRHYLSLWYEPSYLRNEQGVVIEMERMQNNNCAKVDDEADGSEKELEQLLTPDPKKRINPSKVPERRDGL